ncbi:MAG TPA: DNA repair protein RecO C-terminal domain-containing protein, partial [Candidatus Saccharimonadia bacterium]|nr:DNA repair protein RecO C-terminal domain-containing protein [Candidatus Saccharimonadia bacterium]
FIQGRGEIGTLISSRLKQHYGNIVKDIDRVQLGYELIKQLNKATEDEPEPEYFGLLEQAFEALDNAGIGGELIHTWFQAQLLKLAGHSPNLNTDTAGQKLAPDQSYIFDIDNMAFTPQEKGNFKAEPIKALRLLFSQDIAALAKVDGLEATLAKTAPLVRTMQQNHLRT